MNTQSTGRCPSMIEHETAGILRCNSDHAPYLPFPATHGNGNTGWHDDDPRIVAERPLWRYDVPDVPPEVVAIKGDTDPEKVFVRVGGGWWQQWSPLVGRLTGEPWPLREVIEYAPLTECPDPRKAAEQ